MELTRLEREQKEGMNYHFPTVLELTDLVESYNHRIYEKTPLHFDFLYYRLGLGKLPTSYELNYGQRERSGKKDALEEEGYALYSRHKKNPGYADSSQSKPWAGGVYWSKNSSFRTTSVVGHADSYFPLLS